MTKNYSYLYMLQEAMNKQTLLSVKLVELQGEQLMLSSRLIFTVDKQQRKILNEVMTKLEKEIKNTSKALKKVNAVYNKLSKKL